jgi:CDP-glucose 4,6-dehydratase
VRAFAAGRAIEVRNPEATRPWQHVLDAVRGTLVLAERLEARDEGAEALAWNFGPAQGQVHPVREVVELAARAWGDGAAWRHVPDGAIAESKALVLSSERAARELGWRCAWDLASAVAASIEWYRAEARGGDLAEMTRAQIRRHVADAAA